MNIESTLDRHPTATDPLRDIHQSLDQQLSLYRALFVLIDRQRDHILREDEGSLQDGLPAMQQLQDRIADSETHVTFMLAEHRSQFPQAVDTPETLGRIDQISDLLRKCRDVTADCERQTNQKLYLYRNKLREMGQGRRMITFLSATETAPRFLDHRP